MDEDPISVCLVDAALRNDYCYEQLLDKLEQDLSRGGDPEGLIVTRCPHYPECEIHIQERHLFGLKLRIIKDLTRRTRII